MKLSKPVSMALVGLALTTITQAQGQAALQQVGQDMQVDAQASSDKGSIGFKGPTCAIGGQALGTWLQPVGKDDQLQGYLIDASRNQVYEMKATMASYMYASGGIGIAGVGGLFGHLYDASSDPLAQQPIADLLGSWTKAADGSGQFKLLVLSPDSPLILQGSVIGEIRGQFGPNSLFQTPDIATDPPGPSLIDPTQPPAVDYGDDVVMNYYDTIGASSQSKAGAHSLAGFQSTSDHTPIDVHLSGHEDHPVPVSSAGGSQARTVPLGSGVTKVSGSAQKARLRGAAGFSPAVKVVPDATDTDLVPLGDDLVVSSVSGQASKAANHAMADLSGWGDSPAGLSGSAQKQRSKQAAGSSSQGPGSQPGPSGSSTSTVSGQASGQSSGSSAIGSTNQKTGGFVGTWVLCF